MKFKKSIFSFFIILIILTSLSLPVLGSSIPSGDSRMTNTADSKTNVNSAASENRYGICGVGMLTRVTFNSDGGTSIPDQNVGIGRLVTKPVDPVKSGYTFVEWQYANGTAYNFNTPLMVFNLTLFATYKENTTPEYGICGVGMPTLVKFNSNGGTLIPDQTVGIGRLVTKPVDPVKPGYTFVEWQYSNGTAYNFNSPLMIFNLTLFAAYKENTTPEYGICGVGMPTLVKFNSDGGTPIPDQTVGIGRPVTKPVDPVKSGYTFVEWQYPNGTAYNFNAPLMTFNLTLVAAYT